MLCEWKGFWIRSRAPVGGPVQAQGGMRGLGAQVFGERAARVAFIGPRLFERWLAAQHGREQFQDSRSIMEPRMHPNNRWKFQGKSLRMIWNKVKVLRKRFL